jgi:hypothetical protein
MTAHWHYKKTEPFFAQGKDTTRPNFSREERSEVGILIREALQNPLDARQEDQTGPVTVVLRHLKPGQFDSVYLDSIIDDEFRKRLKAASAVELPVATAASVLVIEDFGTKGLLGDVLDYDADGYDQNWNAFWHREGEGAKGKASNGGAGQGKVTYYSHSYASVVFGLTVRITDNRHLLMGRAAFLRDYQFGDKLKYYRAAYWTKSDDGPQPEENPSVLETFRKAFGLTRQPSMSGLSLVVPFAKPFDLRDAITSVILDFYMPIAAGRLEVTVGDVSVACDTIDDVADKSISDKDVVEVGSSFTRDYRAFARGVLENPGTPVTLKSGWDKERVIPVDAFPPGSIEDLRARLEAGTRISIRLPLTLKRKSGHKIDTEFDVYIESPADLDRNEEAFVRIDLLIGAESHITAGSFVQRTRSLTWIQNKDLSDFLLSAEEPTHLKWNASLARDKADYVSPDAPLRALRQAVPRLLAVLLQGTEKKDTKSLARYFARPASHSTKKSGDKGGSKQKDVSTTPPVPPPPPTKKPFKIEAEQTSIRVVRSGPSAFDGVLLPMTAVLELAYEGLDQDPFEAYDPYDFDVSQIQQHPVSSAGCVLKSRIGNKVEIEIVDPDFSFSISGFDENMRLRARLSYAVAHGAAGIETEDDSDA